MSVRLRYAPSPTGYQHIGGIRTALFNYFFARSKGGTFVLRIEDTDRERFFEDALEDIYDTFDWLGIKADEGPYSGGNYGPYFQSERKELYTKYADKLTRSGWAYYCYCSTERLENLRDYQSRNKLPIGYDRRCRNLSPAERTVEEKKGITPVLRFKVPLEGKTGFDDAILGHVERENTDINPDPVLLKSDGYPTYNLANVVDDHLMEISHVFRAQEYVPSCALYVLIYKAFGWNPPVFCHLPMVMGSDGSKLSKRHGATSIREFRKTGYLPEALINYVSLLGWSYDDKTEIFSRQDLEKLFSLEKINKSPAVFDYKKLDWFNGHYIRERSDEDLAGLIQPYLIEAGLVANPPRSDEEEKIRMSVPIIKERLRVLSEAPEKLAFIFRDIPVPEAESLVHKKLDKGSTIRVLEKISELLEEFDKRNDEENEAAFRSAAEEMGVKLGPFLGPLRVAMTGSNVSPPLFESIRIVGADTVAERVRRALQRLRGKD